MSHSFFVFASICMCSLVAAKQPNILLLMTDSMDGRNLDPTSAQYPLMDMHNLRNLAKEGVNMIRTYTNSPQCVPGRTTFISGMRTDQTKTFSNGMGFAANSSGTTLDSQCVTLYSNATCTRWAKLQGLNYTIFDALVDMGYHVYMYGKLDCGADIIEQPQYSNATADGWHNGPGLPITTRSANIWKVVRQNPVDITEDTHVPSKYKDDVKTALKCQERLQWLKEQGEAQEPWFLHCSHHTPHPPFDTNQSFLDYVNIDAIPIPNWVPEQDMHVFDHYMSLNKNVYGPFNDSDINMVRMTYYAMNVEIDQIIGGTINASYDLGYNTSNTVYIFTSDHGEMNMEHRQIWKNSMYEGSSRIPLFFAGPNIRKNVVFKNITQIIDILPTLVDLGGGTIPSWLSGYSLLPDLYGKEDYMDLIEPNEKNEKFREHPNYMISQYHSNMGNTGSYLVRKDEYKYVQFGHYLNAFSNKTLYKAQLFDVESDPDEINDISSDNVDIVNELEDILVSHFDYEYIDCVAKHNDFHVFDDFFWNVYNQSYLYQQFQKTYDGFNQTDWQTVVDWRNELRNAPSCEETYNIDS